MKKILLLLLVLLLLPSLSFAQRRSITLTDVPLTFVGKKIVAVQTDGRTTTSRLRRKQTVLKNVSRSSRLYVLSAGKIAATVVGPTCGSKSCSTKNAASLSVKSGASIRLGRYRNNGLLTASGIDSRTELNAKFARGVRAASATVRKAISSRGLAATEAQSQNFATRVGIRVESQDIDNDGLVDSVDSDDDGDGILDNYDSDSQSGGSSETSFSVFSNFKLPIDTSVNLHTTGLSTSAVDALFQSSQSLAIEVAGENSDSVELDCGTLGYCSAGGTGSTVEGSQAFPGEPGGALDSDADGLGTITRGSTGDFQLMTGASTSSIGAGDTLLQRITPSSGSRSVASGMLNFVFFSNPALKSVAVNAGSAQTIDYSAAPVLGSATNCIAAPATGAVTLTIEGWRPQRPGQADAGESEYVDLGRSNIVMDIPNAPCVLGMGGGCPGTGPGNCVSSSYSTSDPNLAVQGDGLRDSRGDTDADSSNTFSFTIDVTNCLDNAAGGAISWNAGETLFLDLQFRSPFGDNSAQKFCLARAN